MSVEDSLTRSVDKITCEWQKSNLKGIFVISIPYIDNAFIYESFKILYNSQFKKYINPLIVAYANIANLNENCSEMIKDGSNQ